MTHQDALPHPKTFLKKLQKTLDFFLIVWDNYNVRGDSMNITVLFDLNQWEFLESLKYFYNKLDKKDFEKILKNFLKTIDK